MAGVTCGVICCYVTLVMNLVTFVTAIDQLNQNMGKGESDEMSETYSLL